MALRLLAGLEAGHRPLKVGSERGKGKIRIVLPLVTVPSRSGRNYGESADFSADLASFLDPFAVDPQFALSP